MIKYIQILRYYHIHNIVCIWMIYHIKILMGILWWLMDINGDYRQMILGKKQCHKPRLYHKFMVKLGMVYCFTHIRWFDSSEFRLGLVTFALLLGLGHICSESFLSGQWFFVFFFDSNVLFQFTFGHLSMGWAPHESTNLRQVATTASGSTRPAWSRLSPSTARIRCSICQVSTGVPSCPQGVG
jgi:hypothetical protein